MKNKEHNQIIKLVFPYNIKPEKIGLEINEENITFTFPVNYYQNDGKKEIKCYSLNEIDKKYQKTIVTLIRLLSRYRENNKIEDCNNNEDKFPIEAYLWIFHDYLENGIYKESENYYCVNGKGKINWKKTIRQGRTFLDNDNLIYKDLIKKHTNYNAENQITKIHKICVQKAIYIFGPLYGISSKDIKNVKISEGIRAKWINFLKKELTISYSDHKINLLKKLIDMLQCQDINKFNSCEFNLMTKDYDYIFERLIDDKFGNVNSSDYNPQGELKLLKDKDIRSAGQMRPDTIRVDDDEIYVIDSKYYTYGIFEGGTLPDISSISKQIAYAQYIQNSLNKLNPKNKKIYNIFILPKNDEYKDTNNMVNIKYKKDLSYIGYANIKNKHKKTYDHIYMFLINFRKLLENEIDIECFEEIKKIVKRIDGTICDQND